MIRPDLTFEMPPGRIASSISSTGASRTASQLEALAQAQEGDVAVAVVGRLGEHGEDELGERVAVRPITGMPYIARRRSRSARTRRARGRRQGVGTREVSCPRRCPDHRAPRDAQRPAALLAQRRGRRAARALPPRRADELDDWVGFLERTGGLAPDLPGFGRSGKRGDGDFTMRGYDRFLEPFLDHPGVERVRLVVHDWGAVGPALGPAPPRARRAPGRDRRRPAPARLPLAPRRPRCGACAGVGEVAMGLSHALGLAAAAPAAAGRRSWPHFDQGTQRAILQLYRASPEDALAARRPRLGRIDCPALVVWGDATPTSPPRSPTPTRTRSAARPRSCTCPSAGHWPWLDRPEPSIASPRSWTPSASRRGRWPPRSPPPTSCWPRPARTSPPRTTAPPSASAVGQRLVRRPSHARLQRALPAAGVAARPAARRAR